MQNLVNHSQSVPPPGQTITSLPSATAILGQAWTIYKQRFGTFLGVMIIPTLIMAGLIPVFVGGLFGVSLFFSKFAAGDVGLVILFVILFLVAVFISEVWALTALLYAIKDSQERIGVIESYRRGWYKIISYCWIFLLTTLIIFSGFLLLIVPGIIFSVWFSLAPFILVAEDLRGMNALLKSREYVKGRWGSVFWRLFFFSLLYLIIFLAPTLIFELLKVPSFGIKIGRLVIVLFFTPLLMSYLFSLYSNLKTLKGESVFASTGQH